MATPANPGDKPQQTAPDTALEAEQKKIASLADISSNLAKMATLGLSNPDLPKGTIALDGETPIEGILLAYKAINELADNISQRVSTHKPVRVLIHNASDFKMLDILKAFNAQLDLLQKEIESLIDEAKRAAGKQNPEQMNLVGAVAVTAIGAALSSALQLVSLFKVDEKLKYSTISIEYQTLVVAVVGAIKRLNANTDVYDTATMPRISTVKPENSQLMKCLRKLQSSYIKLAGYRDGIDLSKDTETDKSNAELRARIIAALAQCDAFFEALSKIDDAAGTSRMIQIIDAENVQTLISDGTFFLWLHPVVAGGGWQTRQGFAHTDLSFSGGAIVSFAIYDRYGKLLESAVLPHYSGFVKLDKSLPTGSLIFSK